jgi:hypothetical protein
MAVLFSALLLVFGLFVIAEGRRPLLRSRGD